MVGQLRPRREDDGIGLSQEVGLPAPVRGASPHKVERAFTPFVTVFEDPFRPEHPGNVVRGDKVVKGRTGGQDDRRRIIMKDPAGEGHSRQHVHEAPVDGRHASRARIDGRRAHPVDPDILGQALQQVGAGRARGAGAPGRR